MPLVCLRYEPDTTGKGRKCGLFLLLGWYFSKVIPLWGAFVNSAETRHPFETEQDSARLITVRNAFHVILIIAHIYLISMCEFLLQSCHLVDIIK